MKRIKEKEIEIVVYEPTLKEDEFYKSKIIIRPDKFKEISNINLVDRLNGKLKDVEEKIYIRDLYERNQAYGKNSCFSNKL